MDGPQNVYAPPLIVFIAPGWLITYTISEGQTTMTPLSVVNLVSDRHHRHLEFKQYLAVTGGVCEDMVIAVRVAVVLGFGFKISSRW